MRKINLLTYFWFFSQLHHIPRFLIFQEIVKGIDKNQVFNSVPLKIENKFGVDPVRGGNFRMTSDEFFESGSINGHQNPINPED